ncbi:MAG: hypothetical protein GXO79_11445 [Chlorobi bacterium]|nr:hypothetical protein [Chlorobiota bacterium]
MAKSNKNTLSIFLVVFVMIVVGIGAFYFASQSAISPVKMINKTLGPCPDSTGVITVNAVNALQKSSTIATPTITAGVGNDPVVTSITSGTTTFRVGSPVNVLVSKDGYIDKAFSFTMLCGGYPLDAALYAASATDPSVKIKNENGNFMTDSITGGATNQSVLSTGATLNLDVQFQGSALENTGKLIYVVELPASTSANVTSISMDGLKSVPVPSVYTSSNAASKMAAFEVPALDNGAKAIHQLSIVLGSTKTLSGGVVTTWYAQQEYIGLDGTLKYGVENSQGTAKYENTGSSSFFINAA